MIGVAWSTYALPVDATRPPTRNPMELQQPRWEIERNPVQQARVPAGARPEGAQPVRDVPTDGFQGPVFWTDDVRVTVDECLFSELRSVPARQVEGLTDEQRLVGRYVGPRTPPRRVVKLLVCSGVINANTHGRATVRVLEEREDRDGYWALLSSDDRFWTNRENRVEYRFGVRVTPDGAISVTPPRPSTGAERLQR